MFKNSDYVCEGIFLIDSSVFLRTIAKAILLKKNFDSINNILFSTSIGILKQLQRIPINYPKMKGLFSVGIAAKQQAEIFYFGSVLFFSFDFCACCLLQDATQMMRSKS
ncbi:MAG TPA: hypothetical protein ENK52_04330 [Saprospiraceae bacterium]|nr:hypothetical protein [Saprospiraceae bacterium]